MSALSNSIQRAIQAILGPDSYPILIEAVANQIYIFDCFVPGPMKVTGARAVTNSGTVTINVQRVRDAVTVSVAGLAVLAASSTLASADATGDDTSYFQAGDRLQITTTANAAAVDLALTLLTERIGSG